MKKPSLRFALERAAREIASGHALCMLTLLACLSACQSFDPARFDSRLRAATVDAYVDAIRTQFGGLEAAGVSADELAARYRRAAIDAETPSRFYGVLRALLADLDDPHASLRVSPRFWNGPVAEPEWIQFARSRGSVWVGVPAGVLRTEAEMAIAQAEWLEASLGGALQGARDASQLDPIQLAYFLRRSAVFADSMRSDRHVDRRIDPWESAADLRAPLRWFQLHSIDGQVVESPHDAELFARGGLATVATLGVTIEGRPQTLALLRNAGVFEEDSGQGVRRRLHPLELASLLDPDPGGWAPGDAARTPISLLRARRRAELRGPFRHGHPLALRDPAAELYGVEAWTLFTDEGRTVDYLRIGSFRPRDPATGARVSGQGEGEDEPTLFGTLHEVFEGLRPVTHLILDLTGNPGGSWQETGLLVSYFLDPSVASIPHVVDSVHESRRFFVRYRTRERQRLARVDVEKLEPRTIIVLVDQDTASAGEIAASALRGIAGAVLVGERTAGAEFSTGEFRAPDGSLLRIGLAGGMEPPLESFQGVGLEPDEALVPDVGRDEEIDLEAWRAGFRYLAIERALEVIDERVESAP